MVSIISSILFTKINKLNQQFTRRAFNLDRKWVIHEDRKGNNNKPKTGIPEWFFEIATVLFVELLH